MADVVIGILGLAVAVFLFGKNLGRNVKIFPYGMFQCEQYAIIPNGTIIERKERAWRPPCPASRVT